MLDKTFKILTVILLTLGLFLCGGQSAEAKAKKKVGFFTRMNRKIKRKCRHIAKKSRRKVVKAGCNAKNKVMDSCVKTHAKVTGKKKRTYVKGHYKKGNKHHTSGHFRRVKRKKKGSGGAAPAPAAPASGGYSDYGPTLPPADGGMNFSRSKRSSRRKRR